MTHLSGNNLSRSRKQSIASLRVLLSRFVWIVSLAVASAAARSQSDDGIAIGIGDSNLFPSIRLEYSQDSNALRRDGNELENNSVIVKPELLWNADKGLTSFALVYSGDFRSGDDERVDYVDHKLAAEFSTTINKRSRIRANARLALDHLEFGSDIFTRISPVGLEQVEFSQQLIDVDHTYGASQAKGQFISRLVIDNLDYLNNDSVTRDSSRLLLRPSIAFSYRLSSDTRGVLSASLQQVDRAANGRDRTDVDLALGVSWDITGRTGGSARLGVGQATIDDSEDDTDFIAEVGVYYEPRSFSRFDLNFERTFFNNGFGTISGIAILNSLDLVWRYDWSSRLFHTAMLGFDRVERDCPDVGDQTANFSIEFGLQVRRWIALGFGLDAEQRQVDSCNSAAVIDTAPDYEKQEAFAFFRLTL